MRILSAYIRKQNRQLVFIYSKKSKFCNAILFYGNDCSVNAQTKKKFSEVNSDYFCLIKIWDKWILLLI